MRIVTMIDQKYTISMIFGHHNGKKKGRKMRESNEKSQFFGIFQCIVGGKFVESSTFLGWLIFFSKLIMQKT